MRAIFISLLMALVAIGQTPGNPGENVFDKKNYTVNGGYANGGADINSNGVGRFQSIILGTGAFMQETDIDTEAELESILTDVTNVYTNNDGSLSDDNLSNNAIDDLNNVTDSSSTTGQIFIKQSGGQWQNKSLSGGFTIDANGVATLNLLGIQTLTDPNANRLMYWKDASGTMAWLTLGTGLSITGDTLNVVASGSINGVLPDVDNAIPRTSGTTGDTFDDYTDNAYAPRINDDGSFDFKFGGTFTGAPVTIISQPLKFETGSLYFYKPGATSTTTKLRWNVHADDGGESGLYGGSIFTFFAYDNNGDFSHSALALYRDPSAGAVFAGYPGVPRNVKTDGDYYSAGTQLTASGKIRLSALAQESANVNDVLAWNGTAFVPSSTAGTGDLSGPGTTVVSNSVAIFNGTSGYNLTPSVVNIASGAITGVTTQIMTGDLTLANASAELKILESAGDTYYATLDTGDLSQNQTYTLPPTSTANVNLVTTGDTNTVTDAMVVAALTLSGSTIENSVIGASTPAAATFTTVTGTTNTWTGKETITYSGYPTADWKRPISTATAGVGVDAYMYKADNTTYFNYVSLVPKITSSTAAAESGQFDLYLASGGTGAVSRNPSYVFKPASLLIDGATSNSNNLTLAFEDPTGANTITFKAGVTGNVVTTGDSGTVTSTMITNSTIVDADVSSSAVIAVDKLAKGTSGQVLSTNGTTNSWSDPSAGLSSTRFYFDEEFVRSDQWNYSAAASGGVDIGPGSIWRFANGGSTPGALNQQLDSLGGEMKIMTSTVWLASASLLLGNWNASYGTVTRPFQRGKNITMECRVKAAYVDDPMLGFGFTYDDNMYNVYNGVKKGFGFVVRTGTSVNWLCVAADGTTANADYTTSTSCASYHILKIQTSSSDVKFYIDGALQTTFSSNIPTTTETLGFQFYVVNLSNPASLASWLIVDYITISQDR